MLPVVLSIGVGKIRHFASLAFNFITREGHASLEVRVRPAPLERICDDAGRCPSLLDTALDPLQKWNVRADADAGAAASDCGGCDQSSHSFGPAAAGNRLPGLRGAGRPSFAECADRTGDATYGIASRTVG
jgi:hypothetical protein